MLRRHLYVLADALGIFFSCSLSCSSLSEAASSASSLVVISTFWLFSGFFPFSWLVLVWFWFSLVLQCFSGVGDHVSEGAKITLLIFIFVDFAFLRGEKCNFAGVCFGIFSIPLYAASPWMFKLFFILTFFLTNCLGHSWICVKLSNGFRPSDSIFCPVSSGETQIKQNNPVFERMNKSDNTERMISSELPSSDSNFKGFYNKRMQISAV